MKPYPASLLKQPNLTQFICETFAQNRGWAGLTFFLRCVSLVEKIIWPLFMKLITDHLVTVQMNGVMDWPRTMWIMVLGVVCWYLAEVSDAAAFMIAGRRIAAIRASVRLFVLDDLYKQSQQFFHDRFAGSISTSLRDLSETVSDVANEIVFVFAPSLIMFICLSAIFFQMNAGYVIIMAVWITLQFLLVYLTKRKSQHKSRDYADHRSELVGKLVDSISNHISVASFAAQDMERAHIREAEEKLIDKRDSAVRYNQIVNLVGGTLETSFVFFGFVAFYLYLFQRGQATVGDLAFILAGVYGLMQTVKNISNRMFWLYEQIGIGQEAIRKILTPHMILDAPDAVPLQVITPVIDIQHLHFAYLADRPVLQDVSFHVDAGEKIGLVGYSGAGKTTFVNLLLRFYEVTGGQILVDGQDIRQVTQESLRRQIALIPQDTSLFHRTLRENIRIARPEANDDDIIAAARMAGAHDFIMTLPRGYDTMVGERGIKLSGGQRQRVAIARAFLKAAPILVLDEATSALDSVTEQDIQNALDKVMQGRTTLVIAHRLSTLRRMDRVLVFDKGRIVEQGTHDALVAANGLYARMWAMQAGGFLPENDLSST